MLSDEGRVHLQQIKEVVNHFWSNDAKFIDEKVLDTPFDMFEIHIIIRSQFDVLVVCDRSIVGINIKTDGEYVNIRKLSNQELIKGFGSSEKEGMLHNFGVLYKTLKSMDERNW